MSVIFGLDISSGQGVVDFHKVAAWTGPKGGKIRFVIAKATEGHTYLDPYYLSNKKAIVAAGLVPGAYHFLRPLNNATIEAQADWFVEHADPTAAHCLDVEADGPLDVKGWVARYRTHYPHKTLWIYTGPGMWTSISKVTYPGAGFGPLWAAGDRPSHYVPADGLDVETAWGKVTGNCALPWLGWTEWSIMQYASGKLVVPGVSGDIDVNAFGGTEDQLRALINGTEEAGLSSQDVTDLKAYIDGKVEAIASAVLGHGLGSSGPSVAVALQSGYQMTQKIVAATDTLEPSVAALTAQVTALAATVQTNAQSIADAAVAAVQAAVAAAPPGTGGGGVTPDELRQVLTEVLTSYVWRASAG